MKKHALVLGKMMNAHVGHRALIRYAITKADKVTVLLCATDGDRVDIDTRYGWLYDTFGNSVDIRCLDYEDAGLDGGEVSDRGISKGWAEFVDTELPTVDLLVGSEDYVRYMADYGSFDYDLYDIERSITPCSSTAVNEGAYEFYLPTAKAELSKKVYLLGPESTGKTTVAESLHSMIPSELVLEQAREHMAEDGSYDIYDLDIFVLAQELEVCKTIRDSSTPLCIIDSSAVTTAAYSRAQFDLTHPAVADAMYRETGVYLVFTPEVEWVDDGTRLMPSLEDRQAFFEDTISLLKGHNKTYYIISGTDYDERLKEAQDVINNL